MFELIVPAISVKKDYLSHPSCPAEEVKSLIVKGLTITQIASQLGTTIFIVQRVLKALDLRPSRVDYLSHPRCPTQALIDGRQLGKTYLKIASELGISTCIVMKVQLALVASDVKIPEVHHSRPSRKTDYLSHPKCPAVDVVRLRTSGRTHAEIASEFGVGIPIVRRIINAVQTSTGSPIVPVPRVKRLHRPSRVDYLNHPKCQTTEVARLQGLGRTINQIAIELHICYKLCHRVSQAMKNPSKRFRVQTSRPG